MGRPEPQQAWSPPIFTQEPVNPHRAYSDVSAAMLDMDQPSSSIGSSVANDGVDPVQPSTGQGHSPQYQLGTYNTPAFTPGSFDPQLTARGKGEHICPHGGACTKGGVQEDGTLVVFQRNSLFR
jgi:hypothetical protein